MTNTESLETVIDSKLEELKNNHELIKKLENVSEHVKLILINEYLLTSQLIRVKLKNYLEIHGRHKQELVFDIVNNKIINFLESK